MNFIFWVSFFLLIADVHLQTVTESKANDCPRFDYEYKLMERLLRLEFAQRESDVNMKQLLENLQSLQTEAREGIQHLKDKNINGHSNMEQLLEKLQSLQTEAREGIQHLKDKNVHDQSNMEQLNEKLKRLQTEAKEGIQHLKDNIHGHGSTYVRWGRTVCPGNGTELVYQGYAGGSYFGYKGGAADFLCLTDEPIYTIKKDLGSNQYTVIYNAQYELDKGSKVFSTVSPNNDAPCCVCRTFRTSTIMIPGRTECYPGWTMEYSGYLMSGFYNHDGPSNYVCVDATPEARYRGVNSGKTGHPLYFVAVSCGDLPCPPYVSGALSTCVVCSK